MKVLLTAFLLLILLHSCRTATCESAGSLFYISGFDRTEVSLVHLATYKRGSNFTEKWSDIVMSSSFPSSNGVDSFKIKNGYNNDSANYSISWALKTDRDIIVSIPALGREFKIRDFDYIQTEHHEATYFGAGEVNQCTNDGQVYINDQLFYQEGVKTAKASLHFKISK